MIISGSFTRDTVKLSLADGFAFLDLSIAQSLTPYLGGKITITDSTGKKAIGYIKAAGTGETLGDEIITGWTNASYETFASSGKDISSAINTSSIGVANSNVWSITKGKVYKILATLTLNSGTAPSLTVRSVMNTLLSTTALTAGANEFYKMTYNTFADGKATIQVNSASDFACTFSGKQLLTPSATGVTITSSQDGSTYNWASIESGFNYVDPTGYTYTIDYSARTAIIMRLGEIFRSILVASGYRTDLGVHVNHWLTQAIADSDVPCLVYTDPTAEDEFATLQQMEHTIPLEIELKYSVANVADVYDGMLDVLAALETDDQLAGLVVGMTPVSNQINVDTSGEYIIVNATIVIEIVYRTSKWEL